uniref:Nascent polypeptide-associated complex subunit alpha-like UBA domain-containing protein n=1 Tax=Ascaris lumbricoides TaxID=6252 RepID=A0A9J2P265_ASCLU
MVDKEQEEHELAEKDQDEREGAKSTAKNKHDWAAADLEKVKFLMAPYGHMFFSTYITLHLLQVTDFHEDNDNVKEVSNVKLDSLISGPQAARKVVNIRREDVQLIVDELELPRIRAEKKLIEHDGDVIAATKSLLGF